MMLRALIVLSVIALGQVAGALTASATQPGRCTLIAEYTSGDNILSTDPARVCSIEFRASGNNGWAQIYDAANVTESRTSVSEPSQATSGDHVFINFGDSGFVTDRGLGVNVVNGRVIIRWGK